MGGLLLFYPHYMVSISLTPLSTRKQDGPVCVSNDLMALGSPPLTISATWFFSNPNLFHHDVLLVKYQRLSEKIHESLGSHRKSSLCHPKQQNHQPTGSPVNSVVVFPAPQWCTRRSCCVQSNRTAGPGTRTWERRERGATWCNVGTCPLNRKPFKNILGDVLSWDMYRICRSNGKQDGNSWYQVTITYTSFTQFCNASKVPGVQRCGSIPFFWGVVHENSGCDLFSASLNLVSLDKHQTWDGIKLGIKSMRCLDLQKKCDFEDMTPQVLWDNFEPYPQFDTNISVRPTT